MTDQPKRKRRSSTSPTARTLNYLRGQGITCDKAEAFNAYSRKTTDLFGFIDVVALDPQRGQIVGIQVTSGSNVQSRVKKILEEDDIREYAAQWVRCGGRVEVWGWRKVKVKRGGKAMRWEPRIVELSQQDLV